MDTPVTIHYKSLASSDYLLYYGKSGIPILNSPVPVMSHVYGAPQKDNVFHTRLMRVDV